MSGWWVVIGLVLLPITLFIAATVDNRRRYGVWFARSSKTGGKPLTGADRDAQSGGGFGPYS